MCGRFSLTTDEEILNERFELAGGSAPYRARYNCAPTQMLGVITGEAPHRLSYFRWGLIPAWAKDLSVGNKLINARGETLGSKPSFRQAYFRRRCLVPADGFYEWKTKPEGKLPYRITLRSHEPFAMAGIWEAWKNSGGVLIFSFAIITTAANALMRAIHDRMPVILKREDEKKWLENNDPALLDSLLSPYDADTMMAYEITKLVNSPANDNPQILYPSVKN